MYKIKKFILLLLCLNLLSIITYETEITWCIKHNRFDNCSSLVSGA